MGSKTCFFSSRKCFGENNAGGQSCFCDILRSRGPYVLFVGGSKFEKVNGTHKEMF